MMKEKAKYLYITIKDVNPDIEEEYVKWMREEHIPDILTVPGVIRGLRYVSHDGSSPKHMMLYEIEHPDVWTGEALSHAAHTERSKYMSARWQGKAKNIFELVEIMEPKPGAKLSKRK